MLVKCDTEGLAAVAACLNAGGVAVIPTDTVYGLAAHPAHPAAVERLYTIKQRDKRKPVALLAADAGAVRKLGCDLSAPAAALAEKYWPGALTLVLPCGETYEGLRVPDHEWTRELLRRCGGALRVTSANLSGNQAAVDAVQALSEVGLEADIVADGGLSRSGVPSTVIRFERSGDWTLLRLGPVPPPADVRPENH